MTDPNAPTGRHVIFGGDGFVGRYIARDLLARGEEVILADKVQSQMPVYEFAKFVECDVRDADQVRQVGLKAGDMVYNMAARLLMPPVKKSERHDAFFPVHVDGTNNILTEMSRQGCDRLVQFSTDMVYGRSLVPPPIPTDHAQNPIDAYGQSKKACEDVCAEWRQKGINISIFRPRMVMGPGRLGLLANLFKLVKANLPVPTIGSGKNRYQFVSVFDCASFAIQASDMGCPNGAWNIGSVNNPSTRDVLKTLIRHAGSKSIVVPTPAFAVKAALSTLDSVGMTLLTREQYAIADEDYVVDVEDLRAKFGRVPEGSDEEMIIQAWDSWEDNPDPEHLRQLFMTSEEWDAFVNSKAAVEVG
ncbi:MAG: NAD(P)-dependent oxidoreductase [Henriciella sp.]|uniref:NAD-dependent epimerase/dehydratase family protein n=1 Tax=Henriciella sp. TaxID=1968823 RepID=UPI003C789910